MRLGITMLLSAFIVSGFSYWYTASATSFLSAQMMAKADITLDISGHIKPKCDLLIAEKQISLTLGKTAGYRDMDIQIDCNQTLSIEMQSLNGGLLNEKADFLSSSSGFTEILPYDLEFTVPAAGADLIRVESENIKGVMRGGSTGVTPFKAKGNLRVRWTPEQTLLGGRYSDVIEIRASNIGR